LLQTKKLSWLPLFRRGNATAIAIAQNYGFNPCSSDRKFSSSKLDFSEKTFWQTQGSTWEVGVNVA
jgi:hypothetical protein